MKEGTETDKRKSSFWIFLIDSFDWQTDLGFGFRCKRLWTFNEIQTNAAIDMRCTDVITLSMTCNKCPLLEDFNALLPPVLLEEISVGSFVMVTAWQDRQGHEHGWIHGSVGFHETIAESWVARKNCCCCWRNKSRKLAVASWVTLASARGVWVQHSDFSLEPPLPPPKLPGHFEAVSEADGHGLKSCQGRRPFVTL